MIAYAAIEILLAYVTTIAIGRYDVFPLWAWCALGVVIAGYALAGILSGSIAGLLLPQDTDVRRHRTAATFPGFAAFILNLAAAFDSYSGGKLSGAAPSGGVAVTLSSSDQAAAVPASVTVAAGDVYPPQFRITTTAVSPPTTPVITASYGGVTKSDAFTVNPIAYGGVSASGVLTVQ